MPMGKRKKGQAWSILLEQTKEDPTTSLTRLQKILCVKPRTISLNRISPFIDIWRGKIEDSSGDVLSWSLLSCHCKITIFKKTKIECELLTNFYISSSYPPPSSSYTPSSRRSTEVVRGSAGGSGGYRGSGGSGGYRSQQGALGGLEREERGYGGGRGVSGSYSGTSFHGSSGSR